MKLSVIIILGNTFHSFSFFYGSSFNLVECKTHLTLGSKQELARCNEDVLPSPFDSPWEVRWLIKLSSLPCTKVIPVVDALTEPITVDAEVVVVVVVVIIIPPDVIVVVDAAAACAVELPVPVLIDEVVTCCCCCCLEEDCDVKFFVLRSGGLFTGERHRWSDPAIGGLRRGGILGGGGFAGEVEIEVEVVAQEEFEL